MMMRDEHFEDESEMHISSKTVGCNFVVKL